MTTYERLVNVFTKVMEDDAELSKLSPEADLFKDLQLNSIGLLYMAIAIEEEFGISFKNEDINSLRTVNDVINYLESK
ncbi:MAG: acyl carrier protein [Clostridia bacterium]|nr:acyl carrier protein [Clostridia bacterium]MBR3838458.1 acyl carrier protein [Clostridia bacterium]